VPNVLVIGDVIDDIIVVPKEPIRVNTDTDSSIQQTLGGSGSNIACWAASLGADVTFLGCVNSKDEFRVTEQFASYKVKTILQLSEQPTGSLVVLVDGENRSMLTDRGANKELDIKSLNYIFFTNFDYVFISGYTFFGRDVIEIKDLIYEAQHGGAMVLIDPGSSGYIKDFGLEDFKNAIYAADILIPNREEFDLLGATLSQITVVKNGSAGVDAYAEGIKMKTYPVEKVEAVDPTGAGDAFAGGLVATLANEQPLDQAIQVGITTAAKAVQIIGARPQF
jgi:sugar/nucleoside kinase (ribokinase family)